MNRTCYIIDDEPAAVEVLSRYVTRTSSLSLSGSATSSTIALREITERTPEVVFADIDMPGLNGIELAAILQGQTSVIFTTAFRSYAADAYQLDASDYLLKPITYDRFLKSLQKTGYSARSQVAGSDHFFVRSGPKGQLVNIRFDAVLSVSGLANYIQIQTTGQKIITYLTMEEMIRRLPADDFIRIHRSHIINRHQISLVVHDEVQLTDGSRFTIGKSFQRNFHDQINAHLWSTDRSGGR